MGIGAATRFGRRFGAERLGGNFGRRRFFDRRRLRARRRRRLGRRGSSSTGVGSGSTTGSGTGSGAVFTTGAGVSVGRLLRRHLVFFGIAGGLARARPASRSRPPPASRSRPRSNRASPSGCWSPRRSAPGSTAIDSTTSGSSGLPRPRPTSASTISAAWAMTEVVTPAFISGLLLCLVGQQPDLGETGARTAPPSPPSPRRSCAGYRRAHRRGLRCRWRVAAVTASTMLASSHRAARPRRSAPRCSPKW